MRAAPDPRTTLARPDLAAAGLEGVVEAARYALPRPMLVCVAAAPLTAEPDGLAPMTSQLLFGETFEMLDGDGQWAWGRSALDGYVGYLPRSTLDTPEALGPGPATHRVSAVSTHAYPSPDVKARPGAALPYGARVAATGGENGFARLAAAGWVPEGHLAPLDAPARDWVAEAERLLGVPYLWGGRSSLGVDCSGLVQVALQAGGLACPRDSDQQEAALPRAMGRRRRGDLVFWDGHVGVLQSATRLLHATAHHMAVVSEPLAEVRARIASQGYGPVTGIRRVDAAGPAA